MSLLGMWPCCRLCLPARWRSRCGRKVSSSSSKSTGFMRRACGIVSFRGSGEMIETFEGRIGGGKSLSAVQRAMLTWKESGFVATNIAIQWPECKAYALLRWGVELDDRQFLHLDDDQISKFWQHTPPGTRERPCLVIID